MVVVWLGFQILDDYRQTTERLRRAGVLERLRSDVLWSDEQMSTAARMATATGDVVWRQRWGRYALLMSTTLAEVESETLVDEGRRSAAVQLLDARRQRTEREQQALDLVYDADNRAAEAVLDKEYAEQGGLLLYAVGRFASTDEFDLRHERLRGTILRLSAILSASARLNAATGETEWEERYDLHDKILRLAIDEAQSIAEAAPNREAVSRTSEVHRDLFAQEQEALLLVENGQRQAAHDLLSSEKYDSSLKRYDESVKQFATALHDLADQGLRRDARAAMVKMAIVAVVVVVLLGGWSVMLRTARRWETALVVQARELVALNRTLDAKVAERTLELRQTAERLQRSEEQYRDLFENATDLILAVRPDGRFLYVNRAWRETLGYGEQEINDLRLDDVVHPDSRTHVHGLIERLIGGETPGPIVASFQARNGRKIHVEGSASVKFVDGEPAYTRGIFRDLSLRKQAEEERDQFFALSLDLLCIADVHGYFRRVNPAWRRTLGWSAEEMQDIPFIEYVHEDDRAATLAELEKLRQGIDTVHFENRYRCRDGTYRWLLWTCPAPRPNQTMLYAAARDVTTQKEAAQHLRRAKDAAEAASRAKSQFLANMSHELRTPLNAIMGYSYLLQQEAKDDGRLSFVTDLQKIHQAGEHLLNLINEVLDLSKIEAGRMKLELSEFLVASMVRDVFATVRPLADTNGNTLEVRWENDAGTMCADQTRTRQILFNLLSNAAKFTENGSIVLRGRRETVDGDEWIRFEIEDDGIGMTETQLEAVFEEFAQADATTTRRYGGTGLGLAITRRFCQLMGGEVTGTSEPGCGTTMIVRLPARVQSGVLAMVSGNGDTRGAAS